MNDDLNVKLKALHGIDLDEENVHHVINNDIYNVTSDKAKESYECECYTCVNYHEGYDIGMLDDDCGGCCSLNSKYEPRKASESNARMDGKDGGRDAAD